MYKVRLSEKYYCTYNVVPVSLLKPWIAPHDLEITRFPDLKNNQEVHKPEFIKIYMDTAKVY